MWPFEIASSLSMRPWDSFKLLHISIVGFFLSLNNLPWYGYSIVHLTICILKDILIISILWLLQIKLLWSIMYMFLCGHKFSFLWNKCPGMWLLGHQVSIFELWGSFFKNLTNFCFQGKEPCFSCSILVLLKFEQSPW